MKSSKQIVRAKHVIIAVPPALAAELIGFTLDLPADVRKAAHPQHIAVMNWAKEKYTLPTQAASAGVLGMSCSNNHSDMGEFIGHQRKLPLSLVDTLKAQFVQEFRLRFKQDLI